MVLEGKAKVFKYKQGNRNICLIQIPIDVANDSQFPFKHKDEAKITIEGKKLIVEKVKE